MWFVVELVVVVEMVVWVQDQWNCLLVVEELGQGHPCRLVDRH